MKPGFTVLAAALAAALTAGATPAAECRAGSGVQRVALVELFTSEGCSSCPPADRQMSLIGAAVNAGVAPLAFHVDFWDALGWKDPFARAEFVARQRWLVGRNGGRTLYTPHFFVGGREVGDRAAVAAAIRGEAARPAAARIEARASAGDGRLELAVRAESVVSANAALFVAVTESGLASRVTAGENRGATLPHDHVVRHWFGPVPVRSGGAALERTVSLEAGQARKGVAVVAFVQDLASGDVLQAVRTATCGAA